MGASSVLLSVVYQYYQTVCECSIYTVTTRVSAVGRHCLFRELMSWFRQYKPEESSLKDSLPGAADVVVIGGGVIGCSTLYHLAKFGVTNAVLIERHQLTSGTTWHTAGR